MLVYHPIVKITKSPYNLSCICPLKISLIFQFVRRPTSSYKSSLEPFQGVSRNQSLKFTSGSKKEEKQPDVLAPLPYKQLTRQYFWSLLETYSVWNLSCSGSSQNNPVSSIQPNIRLFELPDIKQAGYPVNSISGTFLAVSYASGGF